MKGHWDRWGWRLLPGSVTAVAIALSMHLGVLHPLEKIAYNILFQSRGALPWDERLVMIAIDDKSVQQLGRFPWSRRRYIELFDQLAPAYPSVVVSDLIWSESSPDDLELAESLAQQGQVVLPQAWDAVGMPLPPVPALQAVAIAIGHIIEQRDSDGLVRQLNPVVEGLPALAIATTQAYSLVKAAVPLPPLDRPLWINWVAPASELSRYSFVDVVQGKIPPAAFQDKIVLLGVTATGIDSLITPFDRQPETSSVYLHATVIHNLLQQNFLTPLPSHWTWLILVLGGPGMSWAIANRRTRYQLLTVSGLCLGWGVLSLLLFQRNYLVPVALPITLLGSTTMAVALSERLQESRLLQRQVAQLWDVYQDDLVLPVKPGEVAVASPKPITPRSRVEQLAALADQFGRSQSTQAAIARCLSIGLVAADADGQVWFCNPVATQWLQLPISLTLTQLQAIPWLGSIDWHHDLQRLALGKPVLPKEIYREGRWLELKLEPLIYRLSSPAPSTQLDGILLLLEDITLRKQVEANLNLQIQELHKLSQLKDDFLSTVSHELRSPLSNIKMIINLLQAPHTESERQEYVQLLEVECNREIELIDDLLDLQRLEAGGRELALEPLSLATWLPCVVEPLQVHALSRNLTLSLLLPPDLPVIKTNLFSLKRLVTELINNACKYTPPQQQILVTALSSPPWVELQVHNSGVEIPAAELKRIFEKFYRIPNHDPWQQGGTGLGLALVKKLIEHMGGTVEVQSQAGRTIFTLRLPIASLPSQSLLQP
ncbi:MAG: CHASE2 domain-containing protein [Leptolyngbyaceae cyanobacterium SL_7_1]|nr:CHASE2 domain-containing protein [Leptolyngbyaceae cyanobacterium SL_7_1]